MSLDDLTRATKISKATLISLEAGDVEKLPAAIYTRGFLKTYAKEVGLDPDATLASYLNSLGASTPAQYRQPPRSEQPVAGPTATRVRRTQFLALAQGRRFSRMTTLAAVAGLVFYIASVNRRATYQPAPPADSAARPPNVAAAAPALPTPASESVSMTINGPLTVELVPQGPCWLVATVDGARVVERLMQLGDRQTLAIADEAVLRVGDPGALSISINGQTGRVLGKPGRPVNVKITRENFKEFLSS